MLWQAHGRPPRKSHRRPPRKGDRVTIARRTSVMVTDVRYASVNRVCVCVRCSWSLYRSFNEYLFSGSKVELIWSTCTMLRLEEAQNDIRWWVSTILAGCMVLASPAVANYQQGQPCFILGVAQIDRLNKCLLCLLMFRFFVLLHAGLVKVMGPNAVKVCLTGSFV